VSLEVFLDFAEVGLDSLDLNKGGIAELGEESKAFVDGGEGTVVFSDLIFEDLVFSLSDAGFVIEGLSVLIDVSSELSQGIG
jgi:hypothetical protein